MKRFRLFLISFLAFAILPLPAQNNKLRIPDSSVIRKTVAENWFEQPLETVRQNHTELRSNAIGQVFQIRLEETPEIFSIIVSPETEISVDLYTQDGIQKKTVNEYPPDAPGSWILMKDSITGKPIRIRYYFAADSDVYVQFYPGGNKTLADFVIQGCFAARGVPVGVSFDYFYTASFASVLSLTEKSLPWQYADIHPDQYHGNLVMVNGIKKNLERIKPVKDGCYDENGKPVYIGGKLSGKPRDVDSEDVKNDVLTMNHSGFVKWVVDGTIVPVSGTYTYVAPLLRPTTSVSPLGVAGIKSQTESLSHSLDWTRNLAAASVSIKSRRNYLYEQTGVDVNIEPFSAEVSAKGITSVAGYIKNSGYEIKYLKPILYVLGATEPTYFYLAAVRRSVKPGDGSPEFKVFDSSAVIFPYFDKNGQFGCTVFENGKEMTIAQFTKKYPDSFIHLTRVLSSDRFSPL
ncbi:MAG: hypothetical protein SPL22_02810 [Treponema sp.]|uniref:hypothetical protein n=1 Tax=Treponema sp. TaxID=166 RepID=UPI002A91455C|nr:hypothetical protein [Treponema sp.]MDY6396636.1 hypothetical protein [Treponema sp.]